MGAVWRETRVDAELAKGRPGGSLKGSAVRGE